MSPLLRSVGPICMSLFLVAACDPSPTPPGGDGSTTGTDGSNAKLDMSGAGDSANALPDMTGAGANDLTMTQAMTDMPGGFDLASSHDLVTSSDQGPMLPDLSVPRRGPAPVVLGSSTDLSGAGAYIMLAKTEITNVTGSSITGGHLGLSPAAASFITGFALVADPSNQFSTSPSVVSPAKIYAASYAPPTPTNLTTAVLAMQAAYTDAAGRSNPDHLNLASGNLGGLTLAPGLYNWGNTVTIPTDVTISGGANDTWIFQISNDLDLSAAKNVILAGGAQAKNIWWQVAGKVTIHANSHFEGIILAKTAITLQTTATFHGRAYAQTLIAIDNNAITAP